MEEKDREKLQCLIGECLDQTLLKGVISNPRNKEGVSKVLIRPVTVGGRMEYQTTETLGTKVFHTNHTGEELGRYLLERICNDFKQCELFTGTVSATVLVSKKGKVTIRKKMAAVPMISPDASKIDMSHNRAKNYIIKEGVPVPFLIELGVMNAEGKIVARRYDKFRQINRFLEFIRDIKDALPKDRQIRIIDFGCGKSYLTFAIYYYLHELCGLDVAITGLDLKEDVIRKCNQLSRDFGYDQLKFQVGDIAGYQGDREGQNKVDMVVTLHACDTATDYALERAVNWGAKVILSVPCCQHELNKQIQNDLLAPVLSYGILKERMAAILTDAIRAERLKLAGYETEILEFIDMEHTPKNLLIRAVKNDAGQNSEKHRQIEERRRTDLEKMVGEFHVDPSILRLLG